jgi:hypothetical protein
MQRHALEKQQVQRTAPSSSAPNNGKKRKGRGSVFGMVIGFIMLYVVGFIVWEAHFAPSFVPDVTIDEFGRKRVRRRPLKQKSLVYPNQQAYV